MKEVVANRAIRHLMLAIEALYARAEALNLAAQTDYFEYRGETLKIRSSRHLYFHFFEKMGIFFVFVSVNKKREKGEKGKKGEKREKRGEKRGGKAFNPT